MVIFRVDEEKLNPRYLYYVMRSQIVSDQINQLRSGVAQPQLPIRDINRIKIPIPKIDIQTDIADTVSVYDNLINNNERRIGLLERAARMLFEEWFIGLRYPGIENDRVRDGVPEGWAREHVPDIIEINPREPVGGGKELLYIPMGSLSQTNMTIEWAQCQQRSKYTNVRFRNGDTLLARITPCLENGKTGFVVGLGNDEVACGSTEFIVLRGKSVSPWFVYCLARSQRFRETAIKSMAGSSGRQRVNESCFDEFQVIIAPDRIMEEFDRFANACFDQIKLLDAQRERLNRARDLLLPRLIDGRVSI